MMFRLIILIFSYLLNLIWANVNTTTRTLLLNCRCSYGGLCLFTEDFKSYDVNRVSYQCNCDKISENIYENCSVLIDHCKKNLCQNNGQCISKFGSATCTCPKPFKGQYCQINNSSLVQVESPMVYFIINSPPLIKKKIFIMAHSLGEDLKVTFKSGAARNHILKKGHFNLRKQRDICKKDRFYEDPKACNLIKGNWMVAEIELSYMLPFFHQDVRQDMISKSEYDIPENQSKIYGKSDNIEVIFENQGVETYRHKYMFFYPYPTEVPYCVLTCAFKGCSTDPREVPKILLDQTKSVQTFLKGIDGCDKVDIGGMMLINQSYSLIGPSKKIKKYSKELVFKYYDLVEEEGPHEIENEINSVQKILYKQKVDTKYDRSICKCYLDITFGELNFTFAEVKQPYFCLDALSLKLENLNKLFLIKDMAFDWACDQIDQFCTSKFGKAEETYTGLRCDTRYKFMVLITHKNIAKKSLKLEINIETKSRQVTPQILNITEMIPTKFETYSTNDHKIVTGKHEYLDNTTTHVPSDIPLTTNEDHFFHFKTYEKTKKTPKFDQVPVILKTEKLEEEKQESPTITPKQESTTVTPKQESITDESEEKDNKINTRTICDGYGSKGKIKPLKIMFILPIFAIFF